MMSTARPHIGIITQARMTSSRLPGKILKEVKGTPLLQYHTDRLKRTGFEVIIATTTNETDDPVCEFATKNGLRFHRGSEHNVLERFWETAKKFDLDIVVRVTSDCPLIDPHLLRNSMEKYIQIGNEHLYMSNGLERTFARGFDFEIFSSAMLDEAHRNATDPSDLEHVTPYIWKNRSGNTEFYAVKQPADHSSFRITVDTTEDFELVKRLIEDHGASELSYSEIEQILAAHPELIAINAHIEQKKA